jgi:hypothetical protein
MGRSARCVLAVVMAYAIAGEGLLAQVPKAKEVKIRGYVTEVTSPTSFEIEDYRITRDEKFVLDFDNAGSDVSFSPEDIRMGVEVEIRGL